MRLRFYTPETVFSFGKHQGKTLAQVEQGAPYYVQFCVLNLDHFVVSRAWLEKMLEAKPTLIFSDEAWRKLDAKEAAYVEQVAAEQWRDDNYDDSYSHNAEREEQRRDTFYAMTDGQDGDYEDYYPNRW